MLEAAGGLDDDLDLRSSTDAIRRWLGSGRLQSPAGAFCAWLDTGSQTLAFEYPEITGYALTWLAGQDAPSAREMEAGKRAADWLVRRLSANDLSARSGWDEGAVYTFDLGMIAAGLISFGRTSGVESYVEQGITLGRWLAELVTSSTGIAPVVARDGRVSHRPASWSTAGRAHLVKCAQALALCGEEDAARRLCHDTLDLQTPEGYFTTQPDGSLVMLHPLLYAVEGLWMAGIALRDTALRPRAERAVEWCWCHQLPSGGLPRWVDSHGTGPEQLDVTSQAIRAAALLDVEPSGLDRAVRRLVSLTRPDRSYGSALVYQPDAEATHLNSWVTMFGGQALSLLGGAGGSLSWTALV